MDSRDTIVPWAELISGLGGHMLRTAVLVAAFVAAGALHAQSVVNVNGSVKDDESRLYLLDVDHGPAPVAVTLVLDFATTSAIGLSVSIFDVDEFVAQVPPAGNGDAIFGAGSVQVVYTTPARSGTHQLIAVLDTTDWGGASVFAGSISASSGTIANSGTVTRAYEYYGTRTTFGRAVEYYREFEDGGTQWFDFSLQGVSAGGSANFVIVFDAVPASQARVLDMSVNPPVEVTSWQGNPDWVSEFVSLVVPAGGGVRRYRIEFSMLTGPGSASCFIMTGPEVRVVSATDSLAPPPSGGGGGGDDDGCVAGPAGSLGIAALLPALAMVRRRRRS